MHRVAIRYGNSFLDSFFVSLPFCSIVVELDNLLIRTCFPFVRTIVLKRDDIEKFIFIRRLFILSIRVVFNKHHTGQKLLEIGSLHPRLLKEYLDMWLHQRQNKAINGFNPKRTAKGE